jgi:hypothetical protein
VLLLLVDEEDVEEEEGFVIFCFYADYCGHYSSALFARLPRLFRHPPQNKKQSY